MTSYRHNLQSLALHSRPQLTVFAIAAAINFCYQGESNSWVLILRGLRSLKMQSKLLITGMLLALAMFFTPTDGTVALTVTSGATTVLALTAAQVDFISS